MVNEQDKTNIATGLSTEQVERSRAMYGPNVLTTVKKRSLWLSFLDKFTEPMIIILSIAGFLSLGISFYDYYYLHDAKDAGVFIEPVGIFAAVIVATGLSFFFEQRAEKEFSLLNRVNDDEPVKVRRNGGHVSKVPKRDVVVGDVVLLNIGDDIPADGRLVESVRLMVDESSLTGEPSCSKTTIEAEFDPEATYPSDYVLRGTKVLEGHGVMVVEQVGDATEGGKVHRESMIDSTVKTPLNEQLERLGMLISKISYVIAALIVTGRIAIYFATTSDAFDWVGFVEATLAAVMMAVALLVVAVPEGLPMAITLSLAFSMRRMLKTNNLVRRLHACETMGACDVICTDKTGTLTQNRMQVRQAIFFGVDNNKLMDSREGRLVAEGVAVNSTASLDLLDDEIIVVGNPTEGALLLWLDKEGVDFEQLRMETQRLVELPFATERKYMATIVRSSVTGETMLYVKGAPEIVLGMCSHVAQDTDRKDILSTLEGFQKQGMRTLGFAYQRLDNAEGIIVDDSRVEASDLMFMGMVAIADPLRNDVSDAINEVLDAGIDVKIVTGDTTVTAKEIGRQAGLWKGSYTDRNIITGPEFADLSDEELLERAEEIKIIARARPLDKKRLVEALQSKNHVVAVTGDGTNDAPALKAAHVGLSMGDGTSVAKDASDITIVDNSFASIGRAVMWGRSLYLNIQRFILFQLTVNVVASMTVICGAFIGNESPITVTQMLWVNLIMDTLASLALASLPPSNKVMRNKPRNRQDFIINREMWVNIIGSGIGIFALLYAILWMMGHTNPDAGLLSLFTNGPIDEHNLTPYQRSLFFTIFVFINYWNMFNVKAWASHRSALRMRGCGGFLLVSAIIIVGQVLIVEFGDRVFSVTPLSLVDWVVIIVSTSVVMWIGEIIRLFKK